MPPLPDPADSPCVRRCTLNDDDICIGCGRTLADIAAWGGMSLAERIACKQRAAERWPTLQFGDDADSPSTAA
jgi:predicted Fe-S protein YdhL (DUF1289 family)